MPGTLKKGVLDGAMPERSRGTVQVAGRVGLAALRDVLDPEPISLEALRGQRVAVDAHNQLWTFVTAMARGGPPTGPEGRSISHLLGIVHRSVLYAELDLEPVWVFDGKPPDLKAETIEERRERIEAAREAGNRVQGTRLESWQIQEAREVLDALGVPWIEAPGEADAQLASWAAAGDVDGAITQDYDCALFGSPSTFRNVTRSGSRKPEHLELEAALEREGLTREQLVDASILIGTDYNEGIHGVGPVTALGLVQDHGDLWGALDAKGYEMPRAKPVRELFLNHPVDEAPPPVADAPDGDRVMDLLVGRGVSEGRVERVVGAVGIARSRVEAKL